MSNSPTPTPPLGSQQLTNRGFQLVVFQDTYDAPCSLQISSAASSRRLWLGVSDASPQIMKSKAEAAGLKLPDGDTTGWMPYPIPEDVLLKTRMHLDEEQVRGLIVRLQHWLDTGSIHVAPPSAEKP